MSAPDLETLVCSLAGHVTPAMAVRRLRPGDAGVGLELRDGRRLARCLRCEAWLVTPAPARPEQEVLPDDLVLPRRGRPLRDALVLRLVAVERAFHAVLAGVTAVALAALDLGLSAVQGWARRTADALGGPLAGTNPTRQLVVKELRRLAGLHPGTLTVLAGAAAALCVIEAAEAVGLWRERRWAEYLTALAIAGLLPLALGELAAHVTLVRVATLAVDAAILAWLVWTKRLFGVRGGRRQVAQPATIAPSDAPPLVLPKPDPLFR